MEGSIVVNSSDQIRKRIAAVIAIGFIVYFIVRVAIGVTNFVNRVETRLTAVEVQLKEKKSP